MTDRPIIFSAPMVRALLDGRKSQTRRLLSPQPEHDGRWWSWTKRGGGGAHADDLAAFCRMAAGFVQYEVGDRLYVRETWRAGYADDWYLEDLGRCPKPTDLDPATTAIEYLADGTRELGGKTRVAIHMPRWASRLTLLVEDVRVERLQAISEADAIAEGIEAYGYGSVWGWLDYGETNPNMTRCFGDPRESYRSLWEMLHGPDAWAANPFVVALTFHVVRGNIDRLPEQIAETANYCIHSNFRGNQ